MPDSVIAARLRLLDVIWTPTRRWRNHVVAVGDDLVTLRSEQSGEDRDITYQEIRNGTTRNGCIVQSIRMILGLE